MTARAFLGAGDLYLAPFVGGVAGDWSGPYECSKFEIKPNVNLLEQTSKGRDTYGQVVETVALNQPSDLTVDLTEVNRETLAIALLGTTIALTQASGTLADAPVTVVAGKWVEIGKIMLTEASIVVKNEAGSTTYVNGVDYLLNARQGWIKPIAGGGITDGQVVEISGPYAAVNGSDIRGATQAQLRVKMKLDGKNQVDDDPVVVTVHEAVIAADAAFDFLSDGFGTVSMPGRMKTPSGFPAPFNIHFTSAA
jgi:hypothetical protein